METHVSKAAEAILLLEHAGNLIGSSLKMDGMERIMLVSAIRSKLGNELDECQIYAFADFIPMAFARIALQETRVTLPDHFGRKDSEGRVRAYLRLDSDAVYNESLNLAQQWSKTRPEDVKAISKWSGFMGLVEKAISKGSNLDKLEIAPTLLNGPDEACPPLSELPTLPDNAWWIKEWFPKPWWKFW